MWTLLRKLICVPCIPCPVNVGASAHNPCCVGCGCGCGCGCGYGFRVQCLGSRVSGLAYVVCTMHTMCCGCWCIDPEPIMCVCGMCTIHAMCCGCWCIDPQPMLCCVCGMCTIHTVCYGCWCINPQPMLCVWHVCHTYHVLLVLVHRPTAHAVCVACVPYIKCAVGVGASTHSPYWVLACVPYISCPVGVGALTHSPCCVCVACVPYIPCAVGVGASTHSPCCVCVACVPYMPCAVGVGASIHSPCCTSGMCTIHTMYFGRWCIDPQPILCMWHVCHTYHLLWACLLYTSPSPRD